MTILLDNPPQSICILRLSALGDISHTLPVFYTLRHAWPDTKITWIIGKAEYELVKDIQGVEFIIFDKKSGLKEYLNLREKLKNKKFDVLLHMQMSLRASMISLFVNSKIKLGFDRKRAKDGQWLFTNKKIKYIPKQHVIDSFFGFTQALGIKEKIYDWTIPLNENEISRAKKLLTTTNKYIIISPCSSKSYRDWHAQGYAEIADYINEKYDYDIVLTGGNSETEQLMAKNILQLVRCKPINLIGKTNIKELLVLINGADFMISPDSGPAHFATAMNTPVVGLYATTNPERARPYRSQKWTVNCYPITIEKKYHKQIDELPWGTRVKDGWAMNLITVEDVKKQIDNIIENLTRVDDL